MISVNCSISFPSDSFQTSSLPWALLIMHNGWKLFPTSWRCWFAASIPPSAPSSADWHVDVFVLHRLHPLLLLDVLQCTRKANILFTKTWKRGWTATAGVQKLPKLHANYLPCHSVILAFASDKVGEETEEAMAKDMSLRYIWGGKNTRIQKK